MTVITAVNGIKNVAGSPGNGFVAVKTKKERGLTGTFIDTREHRIKVEDGDLIDSPEVIPGPVTVTVSINSSGGSSSSWDQFDAIVPDAATVDLWDLKEQTYTFTPDVVSAAVVAKQEAIAAADRAEAVADVQDEAIAEVVAAGETKAVLDSTYAPHQETYKQLARTPDLLIAGAVTRNANDAATSAPVKWPDGTPGTYTATTLNATFLGAVDAYTITYGSPVTATYTQPAVTRNANGAATNVPEIVVS